ncbi:Pectate lyase superfamily domain containing protein, partial [Elaphomyces granulatus]
GSNFWYESIGHNGQSPFIPNGANWKVFRNVVTDYGADNTGGSDASNAIIKAITDGSSSGFDRTSNSLGTTGQPAVVYLPAGTYTISSPLQLYVGTVLMGNPLSPAIIKASSDFQGNTLIFGKDPNRKYRSFYVSALTTVPPVPESTLHQAMCLTFASFLGSERWFRLSIYLDSRNSTSVIIIDDALTSLRLSLT